MGPHRGIAAAWRDFLIQQELTRNYPIAYQLDHGAAVRNPILEKILPSLLHVKMTAILDDALELHLHATASAHPKSYRSTLEGRIAFCSDIGSVTNGTVLHRIRQRRNDVAHEPGASVCWAELDEDVTVVDDTLRHLGLWVNDRALTSRGSVPQHVRRKNLASSVSSTIS